MIRIIRAHFQANTKLNDRNMISRDDAIEDYITLNDENTGIPDEIYGIKL